VLNLIPIPPLDGSRVVSSLLPESLNRYYTKLEPFGFIILIVLIFTGVLFKFMLIPILLVVQSIIYLFKIPMVFLMSLLRIQ